jgi:hypothetical protein
MSADQIGSSKRGFSICDTQPRVINRGWKVEFVKASAAQPREM